MQSPRCHPRGWWATMGVPRGLGATSARLQSCKHTQRGEETEMSTSRALMLVSECRGRADSALVG